MRWKKASVEAMLNTAMQSRLDGGTTGLNQLEKAWWDISDIKSCMADYMEESPKRCGAILWERLHEVRDENLEAQSTVPDCEVR